MQEKTYRIQVAAQLAGLSEDVIRAWERRYQVLTPKRTGGGYRVYTDRDILLLKRLKQMLDDGMAIGEAAGHASEIKRELDRTYAQAPFIPPQDGPVKRWRDEMLHAAEFLDQRRAEELLDQAMASLPPLEVYEDLIIPTAIDAKAKLKSGEFTDSEYEIIHNTFRQRLLSLIHGAPRGNRKHVICALLPQCKDEVALLGAVLRFRYACMRVTMFGPGTTPENLGNAVRKLRPNLVALSSGTDHRPHVFRNAVVAMMTKLPRGIPVLLSGREAVANEAVSRKLGARVLANLQGWDTLLA